MMQVFLRKALPMATAVAFASPVAANHSASVTSSTQYTADWSYLPDFDQRRTALANDGSMYCVPTSATNWIAYIAHHGYPAITPGDQPYWSWLAPQNYSPVTAILELMGILMDTDPFTGTTGDGGHAGMVSWLGESNFIVQTYWTHDDVTVRFQDIADLTLYGFPVSAGVGWYSGAPPIISRSGGHAVSVAHVSRNGSMRQLGIRDAADDTADLTTQSLFATQTYDIDPMLVDDSGVLRVMDRVVNYGSGFIDGIQVVFPVYGLTRTDDSLNLTFYRPNKFSWDHRPTEQMTSLGITGEILDVRAIPGSAKVLFLLSNADLGIPEKVMCYNPVLDTLEEVGEAPGATRMRIGRDRSVYIQATNNQLRRYPLGESAWSIVDSVFPPDPVHAFTFDDATDTVLAINSEGSYLMRYNKSLGEDASLIFFPPDPVYVFEPSAESSIAVSPVDGSVFVTNAVNSSILRITGLGTSRAATERIAEGQLINPRCLQIGDDGRVFVVSDDQLREFRQNQVSGIWEVSTASNLTGFPVFGCIDIPRSRNNYDASAMPPEQWSNVLPAASDIGPSTFDCPADMDGDGAIGGGDLAVLLAAWGDPGDLTDVSGDGTTDGADLAVLLAAWGLCN